VITLDLDFFQVTQIIAFLILPIATAIIVYTRRLEKKVDSTAECNNSNGKAIKKLEDQMTQHEQNVKQMFNEHKLEAKDDKMDLKLLTNTVTTLTERVAESQKIHNEFREDIRDLEQKISQSHDKLMNFFTDWLQRIEDVTRDDPSFISKKRIREFREDIDG